MTRKTGIKLAQPKRAMQYQLLMLILQHLSTTAHVAKQQTERCTSERAGKEGEGVCVCWGGGGRNLNPDPKPYSISTASFCNLEKEGAKGIYIFQP